MHTHIYDRKHSVLFRHECCYLLGQIGADSADIEGVKKPVFLALLKVLEDEREDEVTRHEVSMYPRKHVRTNTNTHTAHTHTSAHTQCCMFMCYLRFFFYLHVCIFIFIFICMFPNKQTYKNVQQPHAAKG